jgi:hypothetical protein
LKLPVGLPDFQLRLLEAIGYDSDDATENSYTKLSKSKTLLVTRALKKVFVTFDNVFHTYLMSGLKKYAKKKF